MNYTEKPALSDLVHHGVKGMKWGVRKNSYTSDEIHDARRRQDARMRQIQNADDKVATATNEKQKKSALNQVEKHMREYSTNEDRVIAEHMTRGEKFTSVLLTGPIGLIVIGSNKSKVKSTAKAVDQARRVK